MKQKTKQLQSSGETRKTNRTWHFLSTLNSLLLSKFLLLLIIPFMGSTAAWADTESISWAITTNQLTITPTITPSTDAHLSNASTSISLTGFTTTSSSKDGYCKPFYGTVVDFNALDDYASISFKVADGYTYTPSSLGMTVFSNGTGDFKYKVVISDGTTAVTSNEIQPSSDGEAAITFASGAFSGKSFEGTVTIKLYAYNYSNSSSGKRTYIKSPITISGTTAVKGGSGYTIGYNVGTKADNSTAMASAKSDATGKTSIAAGDLTAPSGVATGYTFEGWYKESTLENKATSGESLTGDITLYANYTINDGSISPTGNVVRNQKLTVTPPSGVTMSKLRYKFSDSQFYTKAELLSSGTETTNNYFNASNGDYNARKLTYMITDGKWYSVPQNETYDIHSYTVTYYGNDNTGGSVPTDGNTYAKGSTPTVLGNTGSLVKTGYTFSGWNTKANGSGTPYAANATLAAMSGNVELYAQWVEEATLYTVTFNGDGFGTPASSSLTETSEGGGVSLPSCTPSHSDYIFQGWATTSHASSADAGAASATYNPSDNVTLYAVYTFKVYVPEPTNGSVVAKYTNSGGDDFVSGTAVTYDTTLYFSATPSTGYQFTGWGSATGSTDNPLTMDIQDHKTFTATFTAKTYSITIDDNGGSADGSATATYNSNKLTGITAPTYAGKVVEGYYAEAGCTTKIADASGNLQASTTYTNSSSQWTNDAAVTLYAKWEDAPAGVTTLPVTFDFTASPWSTSTDFTGASGKLLTLANMDTEGTHSISFRASSTTKFSVKSTGSADPSQKLVMDNNGNSSNFIAIPISGINSRIDIDVWVPYASTADYTLRYELMTGTTTPSASGPTGQLKTLKSNNKYDTDHFNFRMENITASNGVLYLGRGESDKPDFYKIRITTYESSISADPTSVTLKDAAAATTVTVTNNTPYNVKIYDAPDAAVATASYDPTTDILTVTPVAVGTTDVKLFVDEDGDGTKDSDETKTLTIPITIQGITINTQPVSKVYDTSSGSYSPVSANMTVSATKTGSGSMSYQWYKNTVNSNTGGTAISGATSATLDKSNIETTNDEDATFYYCVISSSGYNTKTTDVAYVLTSKTKRYFHMSNVAGNKSTSETDAIDITGQVIAGGEADYVKGASGDGKYVLKPSGYGHYFHSSSNSYFKIDLPDNIASTDIIAVTVNAINGSTRGVKISTSADFSDGYDFTTSTNADTQIAVQASTAGLSGVKTLYVRGYNNTTGYFTNLFISKYIAVSATVTPSTQTVAASATPKTLTAAASGGTGGYTYQWYTCTNSSGDGEADIDGATSATYTPAATAVAGTYYYKCKVTSGAVSAYSNVVSVTVEASVDYYKIGTGTGEDAAFTDGKYTISNLKSNYESHTSRNYWVLDYAAWSSNSLYMKNDASHTKTSTFYVKGAVAFRIIGSDTNTGKKYDVTVDGVSQGTYYTNNTEDKSQMFSLNKEGSVFKIELNSGEPKISSFIFYEKLPNTLSIEKDGVAVSTSTMYVDDTTEEFDIIAGGDGIITATSSDEAVATVAYNSETGRITVTRATPAKTGTATITVTQDVGTNYQRASKTLTVTVKNHALTLNFALSAIDVNSALLTKDSNVPAGSKPTFKALIDDVEQTGGAYTALGIKFLSDDITIVDFSDEKDYSSMRYKGGQGTATIYAYESGTYNVKTSFTFHVEAGKTNDVKTDVVDKQGSDFQVPEYYKFLLQGDDGSDLVTMTYGGYRYTELNWNKAASKASAKIDGHATYFRHGSDAKNEYNTQLKGMLDDQTDKSCPNGLWYKTAETKPNGDNYGYYERIRPFALPCRNGYLKFDVHKTGQMTVYIWQNGQLDTDKGIGSKPRLGYWFDEEGWVQHPIVAPITKDVISKGSNSDFKSSKNLETLMTERWKSDNGDLEMHKLLKYKYCKVPNPDEGTPVGSFSNTKEGEFQYENPYYWMTTSDISGNNQKTMPTKMKPVPYHNGYMIHEDSYLKYVLNVVAGKTYYFFGMLTKIGYAGMNFIVDDVVDAGDGVTSVAETLDVNTIDALHLQKTDDMADIVNDLTHAYTVYNEVTLPSNYRAGKWNTICLPFALSESQVEAAFGYGTQLTLYNGLIKKGTDYTIKYLSHVDRNILPGQPYFIKPTGVDKGGNPLQMVGEIIGTAVEGQTGTRITFNNVVIDKNHFSLDKCKYNNESDVDGSGAAIAGDGGFTFVGAYANPYVEQYSYLIHPSTGNIRQYTGASNTNKLDSYRAYLKPVTSDIQHMSLDATFSEVRENTWDESGEATEVISLEEEVLDALNSGRMQMPKKVYNLMGQEVDPTSAKGLVIINGKKVMY